MSAERLQRVMGNECEEALEKFTQYTCPTLPHLIALLCRPTAECLPEGTGLVVVDSLSALVNHAFPRVPPDGGRRGGGGGGAGGVDGKGSKGMCGIRCGLYGAES